MNTLRQFHAPRRLVCVKVVALLLALLLAQSAALTHAIAHAQSDADSTVATEADDSWGHQAGTPSCQLVDHLLIGQLSGCDPAAIPWSWPTATPVAAPNLPLVCGVALRAYEARGPPRA